MYQNFDDNPQTKTDDIAYLAAIAQPYLWLALGALFLAIGVIAPVPKEKSDQAYNAGMAILMGGAGGSFSNQSPRRRRPPLPDTVDGPPSTAAQPDSPD